MERKIDGSETTSFPRAAPAPVVPIPTAAIAVLLAVAVAYHAVMLHGVLTFDPARPKLIDRFHPMTVGNDRQGVDFYAYYQSGRNFLDGKSMFRIDGANVVVPRPTVTPSPPLTGMTFALVNLLVGPEAGRVAQVVLYELLLLASVVIFWRGLALPPPAAGLAAAMMLGYSPLFSEYHVGQLNGALAFLLTVMLVAEVRGRPLAPTVAWALSLAVKPALLILTLLELRRRRLARVALTGACLALPTFAYFAAFPGTASLVLHHYVGGIVQNVPSALGLFSFVLDLLLRSGVAPDVAAALARGVARGLVIVAAAVLFLDRAPDPTLWTCILTVTYAIAMENFWEHSYVLLAPVCCFLLLRHGCRAAFWVWVPLALPTPFLFWRALDLDYVRPYVAAHAGFRWDVLAMGALLHASKAVPLAVLWVLLIRERLSLRRAGAA